MDAFKAVLVPVDGKPYEIWLNHDGNGDCLKDIERLVGGKVRDATKVLPDSAMDEYVSVYVNEGGSSSCPVNRAIMATSDMVRQGKVSPLTGDQVSLGEPADLLYGDIVVVGYDPYDGLDRSLTDAEVDDAMKYFTYDSAPHSGSSAIGYLQACNHDYDAEAAAWKADRADDDAQFDEIYYYKREEADRYNEQLEDEYRASQDDDWYRYDDGMDW